MNITTNKLHDISRLNACNGANLLTTFTLAISTNIKWILLSGDTDLVTPEPTPLPEYVNPYPITHPCYRFADITNNEFYSPAYPPDAATYPNNTNCAVVLTGMLIYTF